MSRRIGMMYQEGSGLSVPTYEGWSWPAFFFNCLWYMYKGMWAHGLIIFVINICTVGLGWVVGLAVVPLIANRQHREHLAARGYRLGA